MQPSTTALRYFVTAAEYLNFTVASQHLHVTQAAISKQIKLLEIYLGVELFIRERQRIRLTAAGEIYFKNAKRILKEIDKLTLTVRNFESTFDEIHIGVLPTFSARFLVPLMPDLYQRHPEIRLKLTTELGKIDFTQMPYDIVISFNEVAQDEVMCYNIMDEHLIAVASPQLVEEEKLTLNQIEKAPLLTFLIRPNLWHDWFASVNRSAPPPQSGLVFENFQILIHAAIAGLGIALIPEFLIREELKRGQLKQIHSRPLHSKPYYFMAIPQEKMQDEKIIKFKEWLLSQAAN